MPNARHRSFALAIAASLLVPEVAAAQPGPTEGRRVALLRFHGGEAADALREEIKAGLQGRPVVLRSVALDLRRAAEAVQCEGDPKADPCLERLGAWLGSSPTTAADYVVVGGPDGGDPPRAEIVVYDVRAGTRVRTLDAVFRPADIILPVVFAPAVVDEVVAATQPPPQPTEAEEAVLAALDEPPKTAEERAAEARALAEAGRVAVTPAPAGGAMAVGSVEVDLREDFDAYCRTGRRTRRTSRDDPKDLRPSCQLGPFWGYWQPRGWVALGLTAAAGVTSVGFYGAALAARGRYRDAVGELDAFLADASGDPTRDPRAVEQGGRSYVDLAAEVSRTGDRARRLAITGDALLGATALLTGVLGIIVWQDRSEAKAFLRQEKALRALSTLRIVPTWSEHASGARLELRF